MLCNQLDVMHELRLGRSALHEFLQVRLGRNSEHELPRHICNHCKLLLFALVTVGSRLALEELLQLLQRRFHCDHLVDAAFSIESLHRRGNGVCLLDSAVVNELLQAGNAQVAEERSTGGGDDGEVGVVALVGGHEGRRDGVIGRD